MTFITLLLCVLAILKQSQCFNQSDVEDKQMNPRWTYTDDDTDYYDDEETDYGSSQSASNYMSMKVKPNLQSISYQPILLVPDPAQPVQNVIVTKVTAAKSNAYNGKSYAQKNPYDTPPGRFTKQSYGGRNYGNVLYYLLIFFAKKRKN